MTLRKVIIVFIFIISSGLGHAQDCLKVLHSVLYNNPEELINGTKWINDKRYSGSPLLEKNYWPKGDIVFDGKEYKKIQMNYDVLKDEIIIFTPDKGNEKYVVLNIDKLSAFSYIDSLTLRIHYYQRNSLPPFGEKVVYENVPLEKSKLLIKPMKEFKSISSEANAGKLSDYYNYYLNIGTGFKSFSSKGRLIKILMTHRPEMKKYIRKENLTINNKHPENIINAVKYFESLNK